MTDDVADLTAHLVAIDSVNPSLVPGGAGESEIAAFIAGWARDAGLEAEVLEETAGRPSVLVRARGSDRSPAARTLLLCGHTDTVNVDGMSDPHAPRRDGDRLHGRGAYDMKAGVAAALIACREAAAMDPCRRGMGQHRRHRGRGADHRRGRGPPVRVRALGPDSRVALVATEGLTASART